MKTGMTSAQWRQLAEDQKRWIKECGGNLQGYIARYGDPDILCSNGKEMYGKGGTAIYNADMDALNRYEKNAGLSLSVRQ